MDIEIIGAESLGVRSLCCFVETGDYKVLIDPGVALGYTRFGLLPHPVQVAVDERIQKRIIERWSQATDIVISHFHGDHTPLVNANPYQFALKKIIGINKGVRILIKDLSKFSALEKKRVESFPLSVRKRLISVEGKRVGPMTFSKAVPHGEANDNSETVMMTKFEEGRDVFVHASDIQLLNNKAILKILSWSPNIVLADGPPLYLSRLSENQIKRAWHNAKRLSCKINILILDHHLLRSFEGLKWFKRLSLETGKKVICAADFMKKPRLLLEAKREQLYKDIPVPESWHENYAKGKANTNYYWDKAVKLYRNIFL
jgi:predicted metallo-beta-lactamase superfamily hydrolase